VWYRKLEIRAEYVKGLCFLKLEEVLQVSAVEDYGNI
jgi:hypothetical protein